MLRYDNTKLAFHCHACLSAKASATTDQNKVKSAKRTSSFSEGGVGVERESCITDNINSIASQLRLKPMASLMAGGMSNCTSEVVLLDEGDLKEPQEKSEDPVSPPRTAFVPISKQISHFPPTSSSSLSNAAGGTFNPSSRNGILQPLAAGLQSPLYSNPLFKSQVPRFLDPAPHTTSIDPGFPPCWGYLGSNCDQWRFRRSYFPHVTWPVAMTTLPVECGDRCNCGCISQVHINQIQKNVVSISLFTCHDT